VRRRADTCARPLPQVAGAESIPRDEMLSNQAHEVILRHVRRLRQVPMFRHALFVFAVELKYGPVHVAPLVALLSRLPRRPLASTWARATWCASRA
jgi:uncharacterized membrane protein